MRRPIIQLSLVLGLIALGHAWAASPELVVNGKIIRTSPGIVVEKGVSYGPLRAVVEAVGGEVTWNEEKQMAVVCRGEKCVRFYASDGIVRQERLLIPIRKLAEDLGGTVKWVDSPPQVRITMP